MQWVVRDVSLPAMIRYLWALLQERDSILAIYNSLKFLCYYLYFCHISLLPILCSIVPSPSAPFLHYSLWYISHPRSGFGSTVLYPFPELILTHTKPSDSYASRGYKYLNFFQAPTLFSSSYLTTRMTGRFSEIDPERCAHYAGMMSHLNLKQANIIFWLLFLAVLLLMCVSSIQHHK